MYLDCDNCQEFRQDSDEAQPTCKCDRDKRPCMVPESDPDTLTTNPCVTQSNDSETDNLRKLVTAIYEFCGTGDGLRCEQCMLNKYPERCHMKSFIEDVYAHLIRNRPEG